MSCELCHPVSDDLLLYENAFLHVVFVPDDAFPGFCRVIWKRHVKEMTDLSKNERDLLMEWVFRCERAIRNVFQPDKVNLASLGNVVPHLHWHVIPRYQEDSHFPNPIWGKALRADSTPPSIQQDDVIAQLRAALKFA